MEVSNVEFQINEIKTENEYLREQRENASSHKNDKTLITDEAMRDLPKNVASSKNSTTGSNSPECFEIIDRNSIVTKKRDSIVTLEDNSSNNSFNPNDWTNINVNTQDVYDKVSQSSPKERSPALPICCKEFNE